MNVCHQQVLFTSSRGTFWIGVPLISRIRSPTWMEFLTSGLMHSGSTLNTRTETMTWVTGAGRRSTISKTSWEDFYWALCDFSLDSRWSQRYLCKRGVKDWCLKYWLTFPLSIVKTFPHLHFVLFLWWWSYMDTVNTVFHFHLVLHVLQLILRCRWEDCSTFAGHTHCETLTVGLCSGL